MDHQSPLERQAFINHTGQDQEAKLVATKLSEDLRNRDVHTFIDFKSLEISSDWRLKLEQNARCSQVFVAIVSLSYGTRKWCLHELDLAMHPPRPDRTIIPVYLGSMRPNVLQEPPEAWKQFWREMAGAAGTGSTQAMHVERWADNLRQLERFQGYVLSNYGGKDAVWKLERAVAAQILKQLPPKLVIHCVGQSGPLGLNTAASDVVARCSVHQSVAIVGPGGAGKTTLGRVVYNQLLESWGGLRAHVRVDHVDDTVSGEAREQREALALREAMGSLLRQLDDDEPHPEFAQRVGQLAAVLKHPVLLLLDNVRDKVQLDCLLPGMPEQGAGRDDGGIRSHILITTRSDAQLREAGISVYSMPPMGAESARDLFKAARGGFETPPAFLDYEQQIIQKARGCPRNIEKAGLLLSGAGSGEDPQPWQEVLSKGASEWAVKLIDDLSPKRRKMLCDVARILFGRPQEYAMAFWQAKYGASDADLAGLQQSGLLSVQGGLLFLHDEDKKCILEHKGCQEVLAVADHFLFFLEESDANWQLFVKLLRAGQYTVTGIYLGIITVAAGGAALAGGGVVGVLAGGVAVAYLGNVYHTMFKATRKGLQFATEKCTTLVRDLYLTSALKKQVKLGTTVWVRLEPFAVVVDVKNLVGLAGRLRVLEIVTAEVKNADMVGEFVRLEHLSLRAANLLHVPITIKALVNLKTLRLAGNRGLLGLPSLRVLRQLELLDLTGCMSLGAIVPDVPSTCKVLYP